MNEENSSDATFVRLSLDETLGRTFSVYRKGICVFTAIAALLMGVLALFWAILLPILLAIFHVNPDDFADPTNTANHWLFAPNFILSTVLGGVSQGMISKATAQIYLDREPGLKDCLNLGLKKAEVLALSTLLVFIVSSLGFLFLIAPGLYLTVIWFVANPAIVIENKGVIESMKRSWELVSGSWCYVFCTYLIVTVAFFAIQMTWTAFVVGGNDAGHAIFSVAGYTLGLVPGLVLTPIAGIVKSVMYFNLRVEKEGLNAHVLSRDLGDAEYNPLTSGDVV